MCSPEVKTHAETEKFSLVLNAIEQVRGNPSAGQSIEQQGKIFNTASKGKDIRDVRVAAEEY